MICGDQFLNEQADEIVPKGGLGMKMVMVGDDGV